MSPLKSAALSAAIALSVLATAGSAQASLTLDPPTAGATAETAKAAKPVIKAARFTSLRPTPVRARFSPRFRPYAGGC